MVPAISPAADFKTPVLQLVLRISSAAEFKTAESPNYYFIGKFHAKAGHAPRVILVYNLEVRRRMEDAGS